MEDKEVQQDEQITRAKEFFKALGIDLDDFNRRSAEANEDYKNIEQHNFLTEFDFVKKHFTTDMITYFAVQRNHQLQELVAQMEASQHQEEEEPVSNIIQPNQGIVNPNGGLILPY